MKVALAKFVEMSRRGHLTKDHKRNLRLLVVACVLNFSFAFEKFCNITGHPQSDAVWFAVYGGLGVYLAYLCVHDYFMDLYEDQDNDDGNKPSI